MARAILVVGAVTWLLAAAVTATLASFGTTWLLWQLPPLSIDADALGGALTAMALALAAVGTLHGVVLVGLQRRRRWARSAGVLLGSVLCVVALGLGATAVSSAAREPSFVASLIGGAIAACLAAAGYAVVAVILARELGSESAD